MKPAKLKGRRLEQLRELQAEGAISRETAVAAALQSGRFYTGTLSRMAEEGLVAHGYFTKPGTGRSLSYYWLTAAGIEALGE